MSDNPYADNNTMALIKMAKSGDKQAQTLLVEGNVGLVWSIVRRFRGLLLGSGMGLPFILFGDQPLTDKTVPNWLIT